jgi:hypothetical protein
MDMGDATKEKKWLHPGIADKHRYQGDYHVQELSKTVV